MLHNQHKGPLTELKLDIESYISSINARPQLQDVTVRRQVASPRPRGKAFFLSPRGIPNMSIRISPVWRKRLKWIVTQTLLLGFSFVQYEVV